MTLLTLKEQSEQAFGNIVPLAQEAAVSGSIDPKAAFASIIPRAQNGSINPAGLAASGHRVSDGGKSDYSKNKYKVKPSLSDFVVDVELTAKRCLTEDEFKYFHQTYFVEFLDIANLNDPLDTTLDGQDKWFVRHVESYQPCDQPQVIALDKIVREKVGAAFIQAQIYPFRVYMNRDDLDIRKRFDK